MKYRVGLLLLVSLLTLGLLNVRSISAQESSDPQQSLIERLVARFGLKEDEVKAVFTQHREERQNEMLLRYEERLNQLVTEGKLTQQQKDLLKAKHAELHAKHFQARQDRSSLSPEEMRNERMQTQQELKSWAEANGIDLSYVMGFGMKKGMGKGMHSW